MHKEKAKILHNHKFKLKRELAQAKKIFGIPQEPGNHADALKNVKDNNKKAKSDPLYEAKKNSDLRRREKQVGFAITDDVGNPAQKNQAETGD